MLAVLVWLLLVGFALTVCCMISWRFHNRFVAAITSGLVAVAIHVVITIAVVAAVGPEELGDNDFTGWFYAALWLVLFAPLLFVFAGAAAWIGARR